MTTIALGTVIEVQPDPSPVLATSQTLTWELDTGTGYGAVVNAASPFYEALTEGTLRVTETISGAGDTLTRTLIITVSDVVNSAPTVTTAPTIASSNLVEGTAASVTVPPVFGGVPSPSVTGQWQRDLGAGWVDISGATGTTYNFTATDVGGDISYLATAFNSEGSVTSRSNELGPITAAAGSVPSLPSTVVQFDSNETGSVTVETGRVAEWKNAQDLGGIAFWTAPSVARRPAFVAAYDRVGAIHFDTAGGSPPIMEYPERWLNYDGGSVALRADGTSLWTHSLCFMPIALGGVRYIVSAASSSTSRRMFVLYHTTTSLYLRLNQLDGALDTTARTTLIDGTLAINTPYAITLRKDAAGDVKAFVGNNSTPITCNVGTLSLMPSITRIGQASSGTTAFNGYVFDWIAEPNADLSNANCAARNATLLSRVVLP